jgi:hypothetical protein
VRNGRVDSSIGTIEIVVTRLPELGSTVANAIERAECFTIVARFGSTELAVAANDRDIFTRLAWLWTGPVVFDVAAISRATITVKVVPVVADLVASLQAIAAEGRR